MPRSSIALQAAALAVVAGLLTSPAGAADPPAGCNGISLLGTPEELAATPRANHHAEVLALQVGGGFTADPLLYERFVADLGQLEALAPGGDFVGADDAYYPYYSGRSFILEVSQGTAEKMRRGTYHLGAWDCLNAWYGLRTVEVRSASPPGATELAVLVFDHLFDTTAVSAAYADLPTVHRVWPYFEPPTSICDGACFYPCVLAQGEELHYFHFGYKPYTESYDYIVTRPGSLPRFFGYAEDGSAQGSVAWAYLSGGIGGVCPIYLGGKRRSPFGLAFDPAVPGPNDDVVLRVASNYDETRCGLSQATVDVRADLGLVTVVVEAPKSCPGGRRPASLDVPLGRLPVGEILVTLDVLPVPDVPPRPPWQNGPVTGAWLTVRTAAELAATCPPDGPAASLLVPRFEVDLSDPAGLTTLVAVGNAGEAPTYARVVLWTDWGIPSFGVTVRLEPDAVQTLNLRDVFQSGVLPPGVVATAEDEALCNPPYTAADRRELVARHTGQPSIADGLCRGSVPGHPDLAVGYLTVDATHGCGPPDAFPGSPGYFVAGGLGVASNHNVLWGDVAFVAPGDDSAQGIDAVPLRADERLGAGSATFYGGWVDGSGADQRLPLGSFWRSRYLAGGPLELGTDLLFWTEGSGGATGPRACGDPPGDPLGQLVAVVRDESGHQTAALGLPLPERTRRLTVGSAALPIEGPFGQVDLQAATLCDACGGPSSPFGHLPRQSFVAPVVSAQGRFSAAVDGTRLDGACPPASP